MATTIVNGATISSAGSTEVEIQFATDAVPGDSDRTAYIELDADNSGTIQFSVDEAITASHAAWPAGSKFPITFRNGHKNIRYKASGASQVFRITV